MDITKTTIATAATAIKTPEAENETPTRIQPKPSFSNGVLKRTQPVVHHHNHHALVVIYKECLKNHAASLGGHALDGCGEFMPSPTSNPTDPTSLKCAACGCHRNFHRREPDEPLTPALEYQPHHRHHPPPPNRDSGGHSSPSSPSPPPISSSYYPSAPHMLLALSSAGLSAPPTDVNNGPISATGNTPSSAIVNLNGRKRFRSKFTQDQKDRMLEFAERVGWKMQKRDEELISELCNEINVDRGVLKVWMHNNKSTLGKKDVNSNTAPTTNLNIGNGNGIAFSTAAAAATTTANHYLHHHQDGNNNGHSNNNNNNNSVGSVSAHNGVATNGSSSSS